MEKYLRLIIAALLFLVVGVPAAIYIFNINVPFKFNINVPFGKMVPQQGTQSENGQQINNQFNGPVIIRFDGKPTEVKSSLELQQIINQEISDRNNKIQQLENDLLVTRQKSVQYLPNSSFIFDGIKKTVNAIRPVAIIDDENYISSQTVKEIFGKPVTMNTQTGVVTIGETKGKKVQLLDVLTPTIAGEGRTLSSGDWIKINGRQFQEGLVLSSDAKSFALINLDKKYSAMSFDCGLITESNRRNYDTYYLKNAEGYKTRVIIFADGKEVFSQIIPVDRTMPRKTIPLNYATDLKIQLSGEKFSGFGMIGFVNLTLEN